MENWCIRAFIEKVFVKNIISKLISSKAFYNAAKLNWKYNKGVEEELYPYFNEIVREQLAEFSLNDNIVGIGWGKIHCRIEKVDCIIYLNLDSQKVTFAIELKGPSKDERWVDKGFNEDINKLKKLKLCGFIQYGLAIGIYLLDADNSKQFKKETSNFEQILDIDSSRVKVKTKWGPIPQTV